MWLLDIQIFILHILPPHWRGTYREWVMRAMLAPLDRLKEEFADYEQKITTEINLNAQVGVLENYLNRKYTKSLLPYPYIEVTDGEAGGCEIKIFHTYWTDLVAIEKDVHKVLPLGTRLILSIKYS